ncbi:hypothetical protein GCM10022235_23330 [Kribbella ginsengisoli]|uniref:Uncharacterized protein n=1 Tax=Kribbella ginsengisoli TaxID=363865 RepID=A0ABP6WS82_9ACTN
MVLSPRALRRSLLRTLPPAHLRVRACFARLVRARSGVGEPPGVVPGGVLLRQPARCEQDGGVLMLRASVRCGAGLRVLVHGCLVGAG